MEAMSMEKADDDLCLSKLHLLEPSDPPPSLLRLRQLLSSCSTSIEKGDSHEALVLELVNYLDSISEAANTGLNHEVMENNNAYEILYEIYQFISSPSLDQGFIDSLSFDLPKAVSKFVGVGRCLEIVDSIIDRLVTTCSPRDMLSILCEALDFQMTQDTNCIASFLSGLSKVICSIQRRHYEQIKVVVAIVLNALKAMDFETAEGYGNYDTSYARAMDIASSIQSVYEKRAKHMKSFNLCWVFMSCKSWSKLFSTQMEFFRLYSQLLGILTIYLILACFFCAWERCKSHSLIVMQALFSVSMSQETSSCLPFILKLSRFLPYSGLSYVGLLTGSDIDTLSCSIIGEDEYSCTTCFSYIKHGACLSVLWGHISDEVAQAAEENMRDLKDELKNNQTKRWQAIGMFRHILSSASLPWKLKKHAIDFLLCIYASENLDKKESDYLSYMPSLFSALQAVQMVIIYASDTILRKNAFDLLKKLLADIPSSQRFEMLRALIVNSGSSSMIAILLDVVKGEMHMELGQRKVGISAQHIDTEAYPETSFWSSSILELVELVLRPPKGGPPLLPEQSDAVLSALNLYRYLLITEATGKTNHTGVLLECNLKKAHSEWLLPLRTLVTGIMSENKTDNDQLEIDMTCAFNPLELVLYRCIELVEEKMRS